MSPPIGVLDPTEAIWQGADAFFQVCDKLNRQPVGYVVCTKEQASQFACVIDPYQNPDAPLPATECSFSGGKIAWMHRRLSNGVEYMLVANIWAEHELTGTVAWGSRSWHVALLPGEIAVLGGPYEEYRQPRQFSAARALPAWVPVRFASPQSVPFEENLEIEATAESRVRLLVPAESGCTPLLNGQPLEGAQPMREFDDPYLAYTVSLPAGKSSIHVPTPAQFTTPCLLQGEFDVESIRQGDWHHVAHSQYMLKMYAPQSEIIRLSPRRGELELTTGWERQGQLFYSGTVEYDFGAQEFADGARLRLPSVAAVNVTLLIDGKEYTSRAFAPYLFDLPAGRHSLALRVTNTMANRLERYAAPSGLLAPPQIG